MLRVRRRNGPKLDKESEALYLSGEYKRAVSVAQKALQVAERDFPSDHPDLARWLVDEGIESISLNPDTVVETWLFIAGQRA